MASAAQIEQRWKYAGFAVIALSLLWVMWIDERFFLRPHDPEWARIARTGNLLLVHGLFGAIALGTGTAQFSTRLRAMPGVHKWTGRVYLAAVTAGAVLGILSGRVLEPGTIAVEQYFQGGLWALCAWLGWWHMRRRNLVRHRLWMLHSYCFCLVFVLSRVPDGVPGFHWTDQLLADVLWGLVVAALVVPEWILARVR